MITLASVRNSITSYFIKRKNAAEHKAAMAIAATKANEDLSNMPVAGPIVGRKFDLNDTYDDDVDSDKIENHVPVAGVYPLRKKDFTVLSANTIKKMKLLPHLYANPMQYLDYRIYEALLKHTFVGALADALVKYIIGNGFAPELELINPDEDETKNKKQIEQHQDIITKMIQIDNQIEQNDESHLDVSFTHKISAMIMSCLMYNRAALMFRYEKPIEIDGISYPDIPSHVIFAHAQDLGMIDIDPEERRLRKVQWRHAMGSFVEVKDMIYLWNPLTSSKVHNSWYYGSSILSPMISASKILRQLLSEDFPAMAKTTWAGLFLLVVKNKGNTTESKNQEYNALAKNLIPGRPGILLEDPEDVNSFDIKFEPKGYRVSRII